MTYRKYHSRKTEVDGITFDSRKEARRYQFLKTLERAGQISDLQLQVKFELVPKQVGDDGKMIERPCCYIADFVYKEGGALIVEDTKGVKTDAYIIKRKLMLFRHGIRIREV